ncbi:MAG: TolC family protein [Chitinophagaceae bacterium]|nr:TolC family protein [Chitinophagaceae bacterium]
MHNGSATALSGKWLIFLLLLALQFKSGAQTKTLDFFISEATQNSPLLKDYRNQALSNSLDSERIRAALRPQVTGTSNNSYAPVIRGIGYDGAITNGANISALVGVNKSFTGQRNLQSQFETLSILSQGFNNTSKLSEQDLKRNIIAQYITAYGDLQQLNFSKELSLLLNKEDTILKKLTENNVYRQTDYLTFLVTLQQQELATRQAEIQFQTDYLTLNYLSGINDTTIADIAEPQISIAERAVPEGSIFYRQYTLDSLRIRNQRLIIDYSYKPKLNIFADAGYVTSLLTLPYKNFGTSFGFNLSVPIYDGKQRKLQYRKLDLSEETRIGYREFFKKQYSQQVSQLMKQLRSTQELIDQINRQIKYSEGLIQVNTKLLVTGDVRIADLIIALNNYLNAKNLLTQNTVNRLQLINQINYWNR